MLFRDRGGQKILVATHGGTIRAFRFLLERWTLEELPSRLQQCRTPNCCVLPYRWSIEAGRLVADGAD
jgi:broad specificity phosphatase PhoE